MDKDSYETYEFLANTPTVAETNQFFVLQHDGTILTANNEIQYITQEEDVKDTIEGGNSTEECAAVYDVSSQQYYVDADGNASEIISINDQFAITSGESNIYPNNYLIQPEDSSASQKMDAEPIIDPLTLDSQQLQLLNGEELNNSKQTNALTAITLSAEQYHILEKRGWMLLESNDKIFVLNTLGLHDITTNHKLIQKLKNELINEPNDTKSNVGQLKIESVTSVLANENIKETAKKEEDASELFIENNVLIQDDQLVDNIQDIADEELDEQNKLSETISVPQVESLANKAEYGMHKEQCDSIKIKTKYTFKDIPDKICLGKTVNGKMLYAKVKKLKNVKRKEREKKDDVIYGKKIDKISDLSYLDENRFMNLIQDSFRDMSKLNILCIQYAGAIVSQLLRLSHVNSSIVGNNLVVTKITTHETENGIAIDQPTMVTGIVKVVDGEETFVHTPLLLQELLDENEDEKPLVKENSTHDSPEEKTAKAVIDLFHIHVLEVRSTDKPPVTSISFSKRKLPLDVLYDGKKRHPNPVYACGSCGAVFKSESLLKDHQNDQCIELNDELTIDTDDFNIDKEILYSIIDNGNEKLYSCTLCESKFTRLFNCQKHIRAHKTGIEKKLQSYKCKMCPKTYFHSSSLSKHIVKDHIQMQ